MKKWGLGASWLLIVFLGPFSHTGTALAAVEELSLEELVVEARSVCQGVVTDVNPQWNNDHTMIYTDVTVSVDECLKGREGPEITLKIPGGTVGEITLWVSDTPTFEKDEEVILFLQEEYFQIVGWYQGKYTIEDDIVLEKAIPVNQFIGQIRAAMETTGIPVESMPAQEKGLTEPTKQHGHENLNLVEQMRTDTTDDGKPEGTGKVEVPMALDSWTNIMTEDFEGTFPGSKWTLYGDPTWGDTSYRDRSGSWSGYCVDGGTNRVDPPGPYPNNVDGWMVYGPFDLSDASDAELLFHHWTKTETDWDYLFVGASVNGTNFHGTRYSGDCTLGCLGWCSVNFDLTNVDTLGDLSGEPEVWIGFKFHSDSTNTYEGSYLDDITLRKELGCASPNITSTSPNTASAGTNTSVTIYGTGFGSSQGSSTVKFWRVGSTWLDATVVSWTNSQIVCRVPAGASSHSSNAVQVATSCGSDSYGFTVTFGYAGQQWPGTCPIMGYEINENTSDCTGEGADLQAGANTWNAVGDSCFSFRYDGATTRSAPSRDNHNVFRWGSTGGSIATAYSWISGSDVLEVDMVFEDSYTWNTDSSCPSNEMDVQNIATHELGHALRLLDLYGSPDSGKTMCGYGAAGETSKRTLHSTDIDGIEWIYPCATLSSPTLSLPSNGSSTCDSTPYFDWSSVSGATSYHIQVDDNSSFSSPVINTTTSSSSYTPSSGLASGTYFWRVQASNACGYGGWSSTWSVTIQTTPAAPTLSSPSNGSSTCDQTPTFNWNAVSGATSYNVQVDNDAGFGSPVIDTTTGGTSYTPGTSLPAGTYYWRVRASTACGYGGWSSTWSVNVQVTVHLPSILRNQ